VSKSMHAEQGERSPYNNHLQQFLTFLKHERGFADATLVNRQRSLKPFLSWLIEQGIPISAVSPVAITKYFTGDVAGRWKRTSVSFHVQSLRSFFRYASSRGWCPAGISESIDAPRLYTHENLPQGPSWEEVRKLLVSVNGVSPVQIRSRCAILLCAVYGLRVGEVCRLRLEDIDWPEEKISVRRSKQRKVQTYPLTTEVGNALLRYLKKVRPQCAHREVLLTLRRPYRPVSVGALSTMTQKLQKRLGLKLKRYGSHALRHACATHLLAQGLTLKEVGDHLGHVSVAATRIYAKVDLIALREVAALDVRPLVACIEQCELIAAPFYPIGEIQALRDVGSVGLGGIA
jgi:integrase/recombinase XerD